MGFVHDFKNGVDLGAFLENAERKYLEYKRKGDGFNWFHKGIKVILSVVLTFILIFLISSGVVFFFYCFDHSMKPWEVVFKMNRKWGKDGKIETLLSQKEAL